MVWYTTPWCAPETRPERPPTSSMRMHGVWSKSAPAYHSTKRSNVEALVPSPAMSAVVQRPQPADSARASSMGGWARMRSPVHVWLTTGAPIPRSSSSKSDCGAWAPTSATEPGLGAGGTWMAASARPTSKLRPLKRAYARARLRSCACSRRRSAAPVRWGRSTIHRKSRQPCALSTSYARRMTSQHVVSTIWRTDGSRPHARTDLPKPHRLPWARRSATSKLSGSAMMSRASAPNPASSSMGAYLQP